MVYNVVKETIYIKKSLLIKPKNSGYYKSKASYICHAVSMCHEFKEGVTNSRRLSD